MPLPPAVLDTLSFLGRVGVRALGKAAESVLEDVGTVAEDVAKKTKKARSGLGGIPRERRRRDDE